jgi:hypothetical protein
MPSNLAINTILNSVQTLLNTVTLTVNVMQGQRNIRLVIMTAIERFRSRHILTADSCIIFYINGSVLDTYWPPVPVLFSRHNWLKAHCDNRTEIFYITDNPCIIKWHQFFQMAVISLWNKIKQALDLQIYFTDNTIKEEGVVIVL